MKSKILTKDEKIKIIKSSIKEVMDNEIKGLIVNKTLVLIVYHTLYQLYVEDLDNVTISAPTGSGKSIISYILTKASIHINKEFGFDFDEKEQIDIQKAYILTSSIMLQEQIYNDIGKFKMWNIRMLKGANNYKCNYDPDNLRDWHQRKCLGYTYKQVENQFKCLATCIYYDKRNQASEADITVLNYQYFFKAVPNKYFARGFLTVFDEAHLVPDIIAANHLISIKKSDWQMVNNLVFNIGFLKNDIDERKHKNFKGLPRIFNNKITTKSRNFIIVYLEHFNEYLKEVLAVIDDYSVETFDIFPHAKSTVDKLRKIHTRVEGELKRLQFIKEVNFFVDNKYDEANQCYEFDIRDLNEKTIINNIIKYKTHKTVFLSATYGNIGIFNSFFDFKNGFKNYKLASTFDFSKSPIKIMQSGKLSYDHFDKNIHKVCQDTIKIVDKYHRKHNGIIHTGTFKVAKILKEYVDNLPFYMRDRFLFYETTEEKNKIIDKLKRNETTTKYILVGPSLYEGLDLKDDLGRFNILMKAPYSALDNYTRAKMQKYPEWYKNQTLQKIQQAIGRTNRHKNDWSIVYLMDTLLTDLVLKLDETITKRLVYGTI